VEESTPELVQVVKI